MQRRHQSLSADKLWTKQPRCCALDQPCPNRHQLMPFIGYFDFNKFRAHVIALLSTFANNLFLAFAQTCAQLAHKKYMVVILQSPITACPP